MTEDKNDLRKETSAMAVVLFQDKILATLEDIYGKQALSLPKGHVESGETNVQAAIRECFEETGVVLREQEVILLAEPFVVKFENHHGEKVEKSIFPVVFKLSKMQQTHISEPRVLSVDYVSVKDFVEKCSYDNVRNLVTEVCKRLQC